MVKTFQVYLSKNKCTYSCIHCRAHLADHDDLISKSFQGSQGRAYLFNNVVNVTTGPAEERYLLTGLHAVADIFCESCKTTIGWKYEQAFESSQKYKEGKFIIELIHLIKDNGWDTESIFNKLVLNPSPSSKHNQSKAVNNKKQTNTNKPTTSGLISTGSSSSSSASSSASSSPVSNNSGFW